MKNAGEAVYDADKHKSSDDGIESLIITLVCVCVCVCVCFFVKDSCVCMHESILV